MAKKNRPSPSPEANPTPRCKAIILAEKIIVEDGTGIVSIIGMIGGYEFVKFPARTNQAFVFLQLVDGSGPSEIAVEIHDVAKKVIIAKATGIRIEFDEAHSANVIVCIPPLRLNHPGKYELVVLADEQEIDRLPFGIRQIAQKRGRA